MDEEDMNLKNDKVELKRIEDKDTSLIIRWRNEDDVRKHFLFQQDFTEVGHRKWLKEMVETGRAVQYIIYLNSIKVPVGTTYLRDIDYGNKKAEFGIFIGEDRVRGHGVGTAAASLILDYGFKTLKLNKIFLRVLADNKAAIKSYEKVGFKVEGYFRDEIIIKKKYRDIIFMAAFNKEGTEI